MTDTTDIVRRHVEAVTAMLLGNRILQPGAMIVAGELTGTDGPVALARLATAMAGTSSSLPLATPPTAIA